MPERKRNEVHHFNDVASYGKGNDHYWQSLGCTGDSMVDESPGYLAHSVALLRAASQVPRARWVVLLREPVERALSHFMHLPRKQGGGQGSLKGFMEAIEEERSCIDAALHARAAHGHADITHESGMPSTRGWRRDMRLSTVPIICRGAAAKPGSWFSTFRQGARAAVLVFICSSA